MYSQRKLLCAIFITFTFLTLAVTVATGDDDGDPTDNVTGHTPTDNDQTGVKDLSKVKNDSLTAYNNTIITTSSATPDKACVENSNITKCIKKPKEPHIFRYDNKEMLQRAVYVLMTVTAIVVLYFVIKNVMLRRKQSKSKKYGIISTPGTDLEMQPLDQGDDDDDMTLFEARATKLK